MSRWTSIGFLRKVPTLKAASPAISETSLLLTLSLGQSYVALSRAASLDGLQVVGFDAKKVVAHPLILEWSQTLEE